MSETVFDPTALDQDLAESWTQLPSEDFEEWLAGSGWDRTKVFAVALRWLKIKDLREGFLEGCHIEVAPGPALDPHPFRVIDREHLRVIGYFRAHAANTVSPLLPGKAPNPWRDVRWTNTDNVEECAKMLYASYREHFAFFDVPLPEWDKLIGCPDHLAWIAAVNSLLHRLPLPISTPTERQP